MLSRLHVKGYKPLADVEVEFRPLTLLFGPNTAGKSKLAGCRTTALQTGDEPHAEDAADLYRTMRGNAWE